MLPSPRPTFTIRAASVGVSDEPDEARLPIIDYPLHDYRLAGMASITDYGHRRSRLPIKVTNDYRLRFAAIRLAITISRGPLINTPVLCQGPHDGLTRCTLASCDQSDQNSAMMSRTERQPSCALAALHMYLVAF